MTEEVVYLFDGSWDGLLTCVFEAFDAKEYPRDAMPEENAQLAFGQRAKRIEADGEKARRVEKGIVRRMGSAAYQKVWTAFLSGDANKSGIVFRYICAGMRTLGREIYSALAHDDVAALEALCIHTGHEAHLLHGFVRFSKMENGVYYAKITPKNNPLPLLMPFFSDRYNDQPLLIYDATNHLAGVYDLKEWYLVETDDIVLPAFDPEELTYRRLWKQFYHSIAVAHRTNPKLRRSNMPKRYWPNMTEFQL